MRLYDIYHVVYVDVQCGILTLMSVLSFVNVFARFGCLMRIPNDIV